MIRKFMLNTFWNRSYYTECLREIVVPINYNLSERPTQSIFSHANVEMIAVNMQLLLIKAKSNSIQSS